MRKRSVLAGGVLLLVGAVTAYVAIPYLPSSANLPEVRERVLPKLEDELAEKNMRLGDPVFIRIFKQPAELEVWMRKGERYELFRTYPICTFSGDLGPKLKEGDGQSPEGFYSVKQDQLNPQSRFHLAFNLGFPNDYDKQHGRTGSFLMVHGKCFSTGCYAMTDAGIEEIYLLVESALEAGQPSIPVHAYPFALSEAALQEHTASQWRDFWLNLKEGYDHFEAHKVPPQVSIEQGNYRFSGN